TNHCRVREHTAVVANIYGLPDCPPLGDPVALLGVFHEELAGGLLRQTLQQAPRHFAGVGVQGRGVREVILPQNAVLADDVPVAERVILEPEISPALAAEGLGRTSLETVLPELAGLPGLVTNLDHVRDPAHAGFGNGEVKVGMAL